MTPTLSVKAAVLGGAVFASSLLTAATSVTVSSFGKTPEGVEIEAFVLTNSKGLRATVIEYGAILAKLEVPDRAHVGKLVDLTHGYDDLAGWLSNKSYFGSTVGRFGNRIADGKFTLDGKTYQLAKNDHPGNIPCHLHGGVKGFDKVIWQGEKVQKEGASGVRLTYRSPNGEEGYPGNLDVHVTYWITEKDELIWDVEATTDQATVLNPAHHSYWNLSGDPTKPITNHVLTLAADRFLPTNAGLIPTGELAPVAGTPMDFLKPRVIGEKIGEPTEALKFGGGYDHAWVLSSSTGADGLRDAAILVDPSSGREMHIRTNQPAIQFYSGNFLDGTVKGKGGVPYAFRTALCLETENFPDAPNQPKFPSSVLRPGDKYHHVLVHKFKY